ncbi:MAG: DEAD/DEAH box helicase [Ilumatobacteraceae bacterium]
MSTSTLPLDARAVTFESLGVPAPIVAALRTTGITEAFPIQAATLPDSLAGRDVIGRGRTGSGKTVAFAVPTVSVIANAKMKREPRKPNGLILVPTRELAAQVAQTIEPIATSLGLKITVIHGGVGAGPQVKALANGVDIVIACPGRLEDLIQQRACRLDRVAITVLDEADHMADLGFLPAVKRLMDQTPREGQRLLFSATIDNGVDVLVKRYLTNPVVHSVDSAESPVPDMIHHLLSVDAADKPAVVHALASGVDRCLLFTRTKHGAKKLAKQLTMAGIPAVELHGNLSQNARTRNLEAFSTGEVRVLVATDIAARGIHVDDIRLVVHADPPAEHKAYLHRSGRTARAGAAGTVVTVMTPDQRRDVDDLMRRAAIRPILTTSVRPGNQRLVDLVGEVAPLQKMTIRPDDAPSQPSPTRHPRPSRSSSGPRQNAGNSRGRNGSGGSSGGGNGGGNGGNSNGGQRQRAGGPSSNNGNRSRNTSRGNAR